MTLIPEWRKAHRMASVILAALLTVLSVVQAEVLPLVQFAVPARYWPWVTAGFGIAIIVGRLIRQVALEVEREQAAQQAASQAPEGKTP